jgi:heavy metal sensor kinase
VSALGVALIALSAGAYLSLARTLRDRMDARLGSTLEAASTALKPLVAEQAYGAPSVSRLLEDLRIHAATVAVLDTGGRVIAQRGGPGGPPLRIPSPFNPTQSIGLYELPESQPDSDDSCRGVFQRVTRGSTVAPFSIVVLESLEHLEDQLDLLLNVLLIVVPLSLALAGLGGWFLACRSLAPVVAISERVREMSVQDLDQRLQIINPNDEIGRLAATFNDLLARLSKSFTQQRQFMADASHELRTPLSAIRTTSAVVLQREDREKSEYREAFAIVEQQAQRLTRIVEDMFLLARTDAGHPGIQITEFYLDELLTETVRAASMLASRKNLRLEVSSLSEIPFRGDEGLLRQLLWNLLDNAFKYTPNGGRVRVALELRDGQYRITVTDTGGGVPPELQVHIFERFFRADKSRSRAETTHEGGAGLGLPIARWIAEAHGGRLELLQSDQTGSIFAVSLPRA